MQNWWRAPTRLDRTAAPCFHFVACSSWRRPRAEQTRVREDEGAGEDLRQPTTARIWLRGEDSNLQPTGYIEPNIFILAWTILLP